MTRYTTKTSSAEATKQLAATLAPYLKAGDVVVLNGDLGAGKTQFVQGVADSFGITAPVQSPTFNLLSVYEESVLPLYHFDLYRLEKEDSLEDIAFYDVLEGPGVSFIEWGEKFPTALPYDYLEIALEVDSEQLRLVKARAVGQRSKQLLTVWAKDSKSRLGKNG